MCCLLKLMSGVTTKVVTVESLQDTVPNYPKTETLGIPDKETLSTRVTIPSHELGKLFTDSSHFPQWMVRLQGSAKACLQ